MKKTNQIFSFSLVVVLVLVAFATSSKCLTAQAATLADGHYKYTVSNGKATIIGNDGNLSGTAKLPSVLGGYTVTEIGENAFASCGKIVDVTIPDTVKSIDENAFYLCESLESVTIPDSVTYIGEASFLYCKKLKTVAMSDKVTYIGDSAFYRCEALESINIPASVTHFGANSFNGCYALTQVVLSEGLEYIGKGAFSNCSNLEIINIPDSLVAIHDKAFSNCQRLTKVIIPESVTSIGKDTFSNSDKVNIFGQEDSYAETFAKENSIPFTTHTHSYTEAVKAATCTKDGYTKYVCTCGYSYKKEISAKGHSYKVTTTKATNSKDGEIVKKCSVCKASTSTKIYKASSIKLSSTKYIYDGKVKTPIVTVKTSKGKTLKKDTDYTVKYESGRKNIGEYTVTVTFKGNYSGSKKLTFTIIPKASSKVTASRTATTITAKWTKVDGASGYKVYLYKGDDCVKSKTVSSKALSYKFSDLKSGTAYTVKVKTYKTVDGENIYSNNKALETTTKLSTPKITKISSPSKGKVSMVWSNVSGESGYEIYFSTSKNGTYYKDSVSLGANKTSTTVKGYRSGRTYYFKVRAYKNTDSGKVYSSWSSAKSLKIK